MRKIAISQLHTIVARMIRFSLKCPDAHVFESWFKSSDAFDSLCKAGMITCPDCGQVTREKALMTPKVPKKSNSAEEPPSGVPAEHSTHALAAPSSPAEEALVALRKEVEKNSEYVGKDFATEARAISAGDAPERSIYGEASPKEARDLAEEGIAVAPLPFTPTRKTN